MNKYTNADTSPERLAEIERSMFGTTHVINSTPRVQFGSGINAAHLQLYDLLAMLQERAFAVNHNAEIIQQLRQQLHDQRWRRFPDPDNMPPIHIYHVIAWNGINGNHTAYYTESGKWFTSDPTNYPCKTPDWWRPIPPLPKE